MKVSEHVSSIDGQPLLEVAVGDLSSNDESPSPCRLCHFGDIHLSCHDIGLFALCVHPSIVFMTNGEYVAMKLGAKR